MNNTLTKQSKVLWKENKSFLIFISLIFISKSALGDWNTVPSASMKPNIIEGDRIFINKLAYDLKLPFTQISLIHFADPKRNEVIIFESKVAGKRLVKRVIGLPGDKVALTHNQIIINGIPAKYTELTKHVNTRAKSAQNYIDAQESFADHARHIRLLKKITGVSTSFNEITVPEGHYLVMGDNRNISADSRIICFVPREEIIGNSNTIVMSLNDGNYFMPRSDRWLKKI